MTETPLATPQDPRAKPQPPVEFSHDGKLYRLQLKPLTWLHEARIVDTCTLPDGGYTLVGVMGYMLDNLVEEGSNTFPVDGPARLSWDGPFGWRLAQEMGVLRLMKRLGFGGVTPEVRKNSEPPPTEAAAGENDASSPSTASAPPATP